VARHYFRLASQKVGARSPPDGAIFLSPPSERRVIWSRRHQSEDYGCSSDERPESSQLRHAPSRSGMTAKRRLRRTRELLADGNDDVVFAVPPSAANMLSHLGRELLPIAGAAALMSTADVMRIDVASGSNALWSPYRVRGWRPWFRGSKTRSCGPSRRTPKLYNC
jgi:hypothetical protein